MLQFLGHERPAASVREVIERNRFEAMQAREIAGDVDAKYRLVLGSKSADPDGLKARRGRVGGFADELPAGDIEYCNAVLGRLRYWDKAASAHLPARDSQPA